MYPHVVQFETRRHQFAHELRLIRQRRQAQARSRPAQTPQHRELQPAPTTERTPA
jgi:hypothetical protein